MPEHILITTPRNVGLRLFRMLIRWAQQYKDVPFSLSQGKVKATCPCTAHAISAPVSGAAAVLHLARAEFRANTHLHDDDHILRQNAINRAMVALQHLKLDMAPRLDQWRCMRAAHRDRDGVLYGVGQVVQHTRHKYKGVVYGWDKTCQREDEWVGRASLTQPFYEVLVDQLDAHACFGRPCTVMYVPEDQLMLVSPPCPIQHHVIDSGEVFTKYDAGRYIPHEMLAYMYPADFPWLQR